MHLVAESISNNSKTCWKKCKSHTGLHRLPQESAFSSDHWKGKASKPPALSHPGAVKDNKDLDSQARHRQSTAGVSVDGSFGLEADLLVDLHLTQIVYLPLHVTQFMWFVMICVFQQCFSNMVT